MAHNQTTDSSVFAIIAAFASGLDVIKKLKKRRKKSKDAAARLDDEEIRLSRSLQKGPIDIRQEYARNHALFGDRYREGDSNIHAILASILVRLNNGLVRFISTFLSSNNKSKKDKNLDLKHLTSLSEASRFEAIEALSQLSFRLSRSNLAILTPMTPNPRHKRKKHDREKSKSVSGKLDSSSAIKRIQVENVSTPQLAVVRPRVRRTVSGSPHSGIRVATHKASSSNMNIAKIVPVSKNKSTPNLHQHRQSPPMPSPPPLYSQHLPPQGYPPPPSPYQGNRDPLTEILQAQARQQQRRRADKLTPSMYTFGSDSTKLGEIPMHRWATPFDYEEMARKNAEAAMRPMPLPAGRPRRGGLFSIFKRKENVPMPVTAQS